jgi:threonine/homoserine/homoserine lactone efflux protein
LVALGLGALLTASTLAFNILMAVGACLLRHGIKLLLSCLGTDLGM